jgi:AcrR family transcriptional regulator
MGKVGAMPEPVKSRSYRSPVREQRAQRTRRAVLSAARSLFVAQGYPTTTLAHIAAQAHVSVDTVYAAVGAKPVLLRLLLETAISGTDEAVPAHERDYVRQMKAEPRARRKLEIYAGAVRSIGERMGPLHLALRDAAAQDPELARIHNEIAQRRAANMRLLVADLMQTGDLRADLGVDEVADVIWSMNSAEFYRLLVQERGWTPEHFQRWLTATWHRLFLADPTAPAS